MQLTVYLFFILLALVPGHIQGHPHNWISLKTEFILDQHGQLSALRQYWTFDIYYSAISLADIAAASTDHPMGLQQLANDMANNLAKYAYFSELHIDSKSIALPKPDAHSLTTILPQGQQQLLLMMYFVLPQPQPLADKTLAWRVFDPTYYIDMKHHSPEQVLIHNKSRLACSTRLKAPKPDEQLVNYAASLDRTNKSTQGLGAYFAETVLIHCL